MKALAGFVALWLLTAGAAMAEARISGPQIAVEGNRALASLVLLDALDEPFLERLDSGLPTGVVYHFELRRDRKRWFDAVVKHTTLEVVAMYDAVTREYTINYRLAGKLVESRTVRDRGDLVAAMTRLDRVPVFGLEDVSRRVRVLVRVRAELGARTILSFIPTEVSTDWFESRKFRSPNDLP